MQQVQAVLETQKGHGAALASLLTVDTSCISL